MRDMKVHRAIREAVNARLGDLERQVAGLIDQGSAHHRKDNVDLRPMHQRWRPEDPGWTQMTSLHRGHLVVVAICAFVMCWTPHVQAEAVPALRVTAPNGEVNVLMGSIHIAVDGLREPSDAVLDGAKVLVLEKLPSDGWPGPMRALDPSSLSAIDGAGDMPPAPWAKTLTNDQVQEITKRISCNRGEPLEVARHTTNLFLAQESALTIVEVSSLPCRPPQQLGREAHLTVVAKARGIDIRPLETQAEVEPIRLSIPNRIYLQHIAAALGPRALPAINQVAQALNTGAYDLVASAFNSTTDDDAAKELYEETMVAKRNKAWLPKLMRYLDAGRAVIVVGAMHLAGINGLIQLLRQRGYLLERMDLPAR